MYGLFALLFVGIAALSVKSDRSVKLSPGQQSLSVQQAKDKDAELSSYWPTTLRVDTDMNSSWLDQEERACLSEPDENGRIAAVISDGTRGNNHNIAVRFWGGVERGIISDWKCRREGDRFVCRATD